MVLFVPASSCQPSSQRHHYHQYPQQHQQHQQQQQQRPNHDYQPQQPIRYPSPYQHASHHLHLQLQKAPKQKTMLAHPLIHTQSHFGIVGAHPHHHHYGHHRRSSSVSSTITVDNDNNICTELLEYDPSRSQRTVHFNEEENQVYEYEIDRNDDDVDLLWYSKDELAQLKELAKDDGRRLSHTQSQYDPTCLAYRHCIKTLSDACDQTAQLLTEGTHPGCTSANSNNGSCSMRDPTADLIHPLFTSGCLSVLSSGCDHDLLGLERWMKRLRRDKNGKLQEMRLYIRAKEASLPPSMSRRWGEDQEEEHSEANREEEEEELYYYYQQEWLRWHCERISLSSRLFAYYVAMAQHSQQQRRHAQQLC